MLGHEAGIHESFSDVFHVLKGIIPIAAEADKGRFVMPLDFFWSNWATAEYFPSLT